MLFAKLQRGLPGGVFEYYKKVFRVSEAYGGCHSLHGRLLYDYILSKEGQQILVENHLRSIREDVEQPGVPVQTVLETRMPVDNDGLSACEGETMRTFNRVFFHS